MNFEEVCQYIGMRAIESFQREKEAKEIIRQLQEQNEQLVRENSELVAQLKPNAK